MLGTVLEASAVAPFTFTSDMFSAIPAMITGSMSAIMDNAVPILAISIGVGFVFSKIRKLAK